MQVATNARCRKIVVRSLARPNVEKRRSLSWDARHNTECILKKAAPPVATITSDKLSEEEANRRTRDCDRAVFVGNTTEVEDLTQGIYLLLLRKIHTFRCESAFSAWLRRLAVNIARMRLGKKSRPIVSIEATPVPDGETTWPSIDIGAPDMSLEGSIDWINLERCIEQLATAQYLSCTI